MAYDMICVFCKRKVFYTQYYTNIGYVCMECTYQSLNRTKKTLEDLQNFRAEKNIDGQKESN